MGYSGSPPSRPDHGRLHGNSNASRGDDGGHTIHDRAIALHGASRRRGDLFFSQEVMADSAMDIMLTALIAQEQGTVLTGTAAAMANRISTDRAENVIDQLVTARLIRRGDRRDHIGLTALGGDLMRRFVREA